MIGAIGYPITNRPMAGFFMQLGEDGRIAEGDPLKGNEPIRFNRSIDYSL